MNTTQLLEQLNACLHWEDKYRFIIGLGKQLPQMDNALKTEKNLVSGCENQVWLSWQREEERYHFQADCDARIVKGMLAILLIAVENKTKAQIQHFDFENYLQQVDLAQLSQSRTTGIAAIISTLRAID